MKLITYLIAFLFFAVGFSQEADNNRKKERSNKNTERTMRNQERDIYRGSLYELRDEEKFTSNDQFYTFTRDDRGMNVTRKMQNGQEENFGRLRSTTTEGFYILRSTKDNTVSFGQFDHNGNFRTYRYDPATDTIVEQAFINSEPMNRGVQTRTRTGQRSNPNNGN